MDSVATVAYIENWWEVTKWIINFEWTALLISTKLLIHSFPVFTSTDKILYT